MINSLQIGKWYRQTGENHGYLYQYKGKRREKYLFDRYRDGIIEQNNVPVSEKYIRFYQNPLETLTPSEALILLANGFVLFHKNENFIVKLENGDLIHMEFDGSNVWKNCFLYRYINFTIHALPEGEK